MIDRSECIFFINTPNSIKNKDIDSGSDNFTYSPWIYHELLVAKTISIKEPIRESLLLENINKSTAADQVFNKSFRVLYDASTSNFVELDCCKLEAWGILHSKNNKNSYALDSLYKHFK